jgi:aryl-alcohol dehydrogenase-like predicted oxidoreductase
MLVRDKFETEYERIFSVHKFGSTVFSPLASGMLTGKYNDSLDVEGRFTNLSDDSSVKNKIKQYFGTPEGIK